MGVYYCDSSAIVKRYISEPGSQWVVFEQHLATEYQIVDVTRSVAQSAIGLAERHGLRGYDAVQLASALAVHGERSAVGLPVLTFVSADELLSNAAQAEGLSENPNNFP